MVPVLFVDSNHEKEDLCHQVSDLNSAKTVALVEVNILPQVGLE